jgi:hypothetical protein
MSVKKIAWHLFYNLIRYRGCRLMIVKSGGSGLSFLWLPHFERFATFHPIVFLSSETVGGLMIEFS